MSKKKKQKIEMVKVLPEGLCPNCRGEQFIVYENESNIFLTDLNGRAIDQRNFNYRCEGKCLRCDAVYEMMPTTERFIPLTPLRKIMLDYTSLPSDVDQVAEYIDNPMEG